MHRIRCYQPQRRCEGKRTGAILILVMAILLLLTVMTTGLLSLARVDGVEASHVVTKTQAYWAAEAGAEHAKTLGQLRRIPFEYYDFPKGGTNYLWGTNVLRGTTAGGSYTVDIVSDPAWTNTIHALKRYIISSHGVSKVGDKQTVTLTAAIQSYASYVWASNYERMPDGTTLIYFRSADVLDGPLYSNDQLNIQGGSPDPVFKQLAATASNKVNYTSGADQTVFQGGLTLNAPKLDIAGTFTSDHVQDVKIDAQRAGTDGLILTNGNYKIVFKSNGQFTYQKGTISGTPAKISLSGPLKTNLFALSYYTNGLPLYVDGSAFVEGTVNGRVTVGARDSIYITNNIVYESATNPPPPWSGTTNAFVASHVNDTLGLIASNQVQVIATNQIEIHAAIMVTSGDAGFNVANYNTGAWGLPQLRVYGGITQYRRGTVGYGSSYGFSKNYKFDTRFLTDAPPNFPYSIYVFSDWKQSGN